MRLALRAALILVILVLGAAAEEPSQVLPPASLWITYNVTLHAPTGGVEPYRWNLLAGSLPPGMKLDEFGRLTGTPEDSGQYEFTASARDRSQPPIETKEKFTLLVETPLGLEWGRKIQVNGPRIDGSVKVSNRTGRDFDLTFVVLAVNEIGRATAIGYQHFSLKKNTRDLEIPFGDTPSAGNYVVNVDVVGEEPISNRIFRARMVTENVSVATN